jgi:hypothetical protein
VDYKHFFSHLPSLYDDWGTPSTRPRSPRFAEILERVSGMTKPSVLQLLNYAVACLEKGDVYLEVGSYRGATLIGALEGNSTANAYAIDNFSEFDPTGDGLAILQQNLESFAIGGQVAFSDGDFEEILTSQSFVGNAKGKVGVYLYDAAHDYRSQFMGLLLIRPLLATRGVLIVDDANWDAVAQATDDFVRVEPRCRLELRLANGGTFWNGLDVLSWDRGRGSAAPQADSRRPNLLAAMKRFASEYEQSEDDHG